MLEERAHQCPILTNVGELGVHAFFQLLARLQRPTRISDALGMTSH